MSQPPNACYSPVTPADNDLLLRQVKIAAPCSVQWETMPGGERVRSCAQCNHKVYNLSEMSSDAAASLIRDAEGRVCVRLYRRADGSVMTRDCPTGIRAARQRIGRTVAVSFASMFSILGLFSLAERFRTKPEAAGVKQEINAPVLLPMAGEVISEVQDPTVPVPTPPDSGYTLGMVAPSPDAEKTFLPHEAEPTEIRHDPFVPLPKAAKGTAESESAARP